MLCRKGVFTTFPKFTGKHLYRSQSSFRPFLITFLYKACNFIKKGTLTQVFSCEFCEISRKTWLLGTAWECLWWLLRTHLDGCFCQITSNSHISWQHFPKEHWFLQYLAFPYWNESTLFSTKRFDEREALKPSSNNLLYSYLGYAWLPASHLFRDFLSVLFYCIIQLHSTSPTLNRFITTMDLLFRSNLRYLRKLIKLIPLQGSRYVNLFRKIEKFATFIDNLDMKFRHKS